MGAAMNKHEHIAAIGAAVDKALAELPKGDQADLYQVMLRSIPWAHVRRNVKMRNQHAKSVFAVFWPKGDARRIIADSEYKDPMDAWLCCFGCRNEAEVEELKQQGYSVRKIWLDIA